MITSIADHRREREGADERGIPARERAVAGEERRARLTGGAGLTARERRVWHERDARGGWAALGLGRWRSANTRERGGRGFGPDSAQPRRGRFPFF